MKAKHSAEEVLAYAEALREALRMHRAGRSTMFSLENSAAAAPDMLNNLAERIKADEGAVPFCRVEDVDANVSHMAQTGVNPGDPLYLHPPAQAVQVDEVESRLAAANALLRLCAGNVSNPLVIAIQNHLQGTAEPVAQGEADLCDCDADKYNKLPHHADCAALAAQPRAVPDGRKLVGYVWPHECDYDHLHRCLGEDGDLEVRRIPSGAVGVYAMLAAAIKGVA